MNSLVNYLSGVILATLLLTGASLSAQSPPAGKNTGGPSGRQTTAGPAPSGKLNFQTDIFTGSFGYSVPIEGAPGRGGSAPELGIVYNSGGENGWCGMGWSLDLGHIQRETKRGVPIKWTAPNPLSEYDDAKGFVFSLNGTSSTLVPVGGGIYRSEIEGGFLHFQLDSTSNRWIVTDKSGNKYFFGETSSSRMESTRSGWTAGAVSSTFRWALNKTVTASGDTSSITYTKDGNKLYPVNYAYNGHTNGGFAETHTIEFELENRTDDKPFTYISGYKVQTNKRLKSVTCKVGATLVRKYQLTYTSSPSTKRSLLNTVTVVGNNGTDTLPPFTFTYQEKPFKFLTESTWTNVYFPTSDDIWKKVHGSSSTGHFADLVDVDGDGLNDRVLSSHSNPYNKFIVQRNLGTGFGPTNYWSPVGAQGKTTQPEWGIINSVVTRFADINGDGLPDRVMDPVAVYDANATYASYVVELNSGVGFDSQVSWSDVIAPTSDVIGQTTVLKAIENAPHVKLLDMNGDGLPDRVLRSLGKIVSSTYVYTNYLVQFNTGSGFTSTNWWGPIGAQARSNSLDWAGIESPYVKLTDLNGDGLPDRVMAPANSSGPLTGSAFNRFVVEFNNGSGFEQAVDWTGVDPQSTSASGAQTSLHQYIEVPPYVKLADINGDQLPDRIMTRADISGVVTNWWVQINTGNGFAAVRDYACQYNQGVNSADSAEAFAAIEHSGAVSLIDISGDGLPDHVMFDKTGNNNFIVAVSAGPFPDLLASVNNGVGGFVKPSYLPSTLYDNRNTNTIAPAATNMVKRLLPFSVQTVSATTMSDGIHMTNTTSYFYAGGFWSPSRREFSGFARVIVRDPLGGTNINWFHQGGGWDSSLQGETTDTLGKKGMPFRVETIGTNGTAYALTLNKVHDEDLGNGRRFGYVEQTIELDYPDTGVGYRARASRFTYDVANGNPTSTVELGEVNNVNLLTHESDDIANDAVYSFNEYATLANTAIIDKPARSIVTSDALGTLILRESLFEYVGQTGDLVRQRDRICLGSYSTNSFGYDSNGNVRWTTNSAGVVTETTYDTTYRALPAQQTIAANYTTTLSHDIRSGALLSSTDPAGLVTAITYDTFYRPTEESVSSTANGAANVWRIRHTYGLGGVSGGVSLNYLRTRSNDGVDATDGHEDWTYMDGIGRVIQKRVEAEANGYRVTDTRYDARSAVLFVSHPYFSGGTVAGNSAYVAPTGTKLGITTDFDPIGRAIKNSPADSGSFTAAGVLTSVTAGTGDVGAPVGASQITYRDGNDPWIKVVTDPESKVHKYHLDAYERTNQIVEVTGAGNYTTTLKHDLMGQLTEIVDHLSNKIEYAYDDLGQLVAMADPHLGRWDYLRDFAGRVREQTDANGNRTVYHYNDPLGRLKKVEIYDRNNDLKKETTNFYDTGEAGYTVYAGQLFKVVDNEGWAKNSYDVRGRILKTTRHVTVNQKTYTFEQTFDDADRVKTVTYPNSLLGVTHTYDTGGNLVTVQQTGGGTTWFQAGNFNEFGQLLNGMFGNGVGTTNQYFASSRKLKQLSAAKGSTFLQKLAYTYDKAANLKSIDDQVYEDDASSEITDIIYDDLHRLTSLTRPEVSQTTTYSYGATGNISVNGEAGAGTYQYGTIRPQAVKSANGKNYAYDANGNMTVMGDKVLAYDEANNLVRVSLSLTDGVTFGYAGGTRLWKRRNDTVIQVWIGNIFEEKEGKSLCHIFAGNKRVATYEPTGTLTSDVGTTSTYYYHGDHLVSSSFLTDHAGNLVDHYDYSAFGRERYNDPLESTSMTHRFTGQPYDPETGLYFLGYRYFSPELGRFIQPDTIVADLGNPQSFNRYSYTMNNPLRYVDPSGNAGKEIADWWESKVNTAFEFYTRGSKSTVVIGTLGTINTLVGGVADPLRLGSDAGTVSAGGATKGEIAMAVLVEGGRIVSLVPVGTAVGNAAGKTAQTLKATRAEAAAARATKGGGVADLPMQGGQFANPRSMRNVNPLRDRLNCGECAVYGDEILAGGKAVAARRSGLTDTSNIERHYGRSFVHFDDAAALRQSIAGMPVGSRGIVFGVLPGEPNGHYFNFINTRSGPVFLDFQRGGTTSPLEFLGLRLMKTN